MNLPPMSGDVSNTHISEADEQRLRELAMAFAKGVEDDNALLARLGFSREDYEELAQTRTFKAMLEQAQGEWEAAANTRKRIRLKAAINIEQSLPSFYDAMIDPKEPLSSRVKVLEVVARIGDLSTPELQPAGGGQYFKLEINLGQNKPPIIIENNIEDMGREHERGQLQELPLDKTRVVSKVWDNVERTSL